MKDYLCLLFPVLILAGFWLAWHSDYAIETELEDEPRNWRIEDDYHGGPVRIIPDDERGRER